MPVKPQFPPISGSITQQSEAPAPTPTHTPPRERPPVSPARPRRRAGRQVGSFCQSFERRREPIGVPASPARTAAPGPDFHGWSHLRKHGRARTVSSRRDQGSPQLAQPRAMAMAMATATATAETSSPVFPSPMYRVVPKPGAGARCNASAEAGPSGRRPHRPLGPAPGRPPSRSLFTRYGPKPRPPRRCPASGPVQPAGGALGPNTGRGEWTAPTRAVAQSASAARAAQKSAHCGAG